MWKYQSKKDREIVRLTTLLDAAAYVVSARDFRIYKLLNELTTRSGELAGVMDKYYQLQSEYGRLLESIPASAPVPPISRQPLYLTEEQEDIEFAYANDMIDKATYEDMLTQLAFDNSEITYDYERID